MQNFGKINETFKDIFADGVVSKNKKNDLTFKAYIKELKKNPILRVQYHVYNKLENKIYEDIERSNILVDECISFLTNLDKEKVNEINTKLVNFLTKQGFKLSEGYELEALHEHISNLAFSKKTPKSINSIIESKIFINNYVKKEEINEHKEVEPYANHFLGPAMVEKFNEKYSNLSEIEKKVLKNIIENKVDENKTIYDNMIIECVDLINLRLDDECNIQEKDTLLQVKDKLLRYKYNEDNYISEITRLIELKKDLK